MGRGARYAARMTGLPLPEFSMLQRVPQWLLDSDESRRKAAAAIAAILHFRPQIDRELNGSKLGSIADHLGEAAFDTACAQPCPPMDQCADRDASLPRPEQMAAIGQSILNRALPMALSIRYPEATGDAHAFLLADHAYGLVGARAADA